MTVRSDTGDMPFKSTIRIPSEVLDVIVSLTERTPSFANQSATDARQSAETPDAAVRP